MSKLTRYQAICQNSKSSIDLEIIWNSYYRLKSSLEQKPSSGSRRSYTKSPCKESAAKNSTLQSCTYKISKRLGVLYGLSSPEILKQRTGQRFLSYTTPRGGSTKSRVPPWESIHPTGSTFFNEKPSYLRVQKIKGSHDPGKQSSQ